jgi:hypothetical protein
VVIFASVSSMAKAQEAFLNLPKDASRRVTNHTHNDAMQAWKKKEKARSVACRVAKEWGEDTPTKFDSSYEEEGGGGNSTSPVSTMHNPSAIQ